PGQRAMIARRVERPGAGVLAQQPRLAWYVRGRDREPREHVEEELVRDADGTIHHLPLLQRESHVVLRGAGQELTRRHRLMQAEPLGHAAFVRQRVERLPRGAVDAAAEMQFNRRAHLTDGAYGVLNSAVEPDDLRIPVHRQLGPSSIPVLTAGE